MSGLMLKLPENASLELRARAVADASMNHALHGDKRREHVCAVALEQLRAAVENAVAKAEPQAKTKGKR